MVESARRKQRKSRGPTIKWLFVSILTGIALGVQVFPAAARDQVPSGQQNTVLIQSFVHPSPALEKKEWYEQGPWPLVGAVAALMVTNAVAVGLVYLQSARGFNAVLRQRRIETLSTSLSEFYNPLLAILDINGEIFNKTGPPSFPDGEIERDAAMMIWRETKQIILTNNAQILEILRSKTHLLDSADALNSYNDLMIHVAMYETFQRIETDRYRNFQFPKGVHVHVAQMRSLVLKEFDDLTGAQI